MSKTPRTDEHLRRKQENGYVVIVSGDFARQLETELADARAEIERLNKNMRFATAINLAMQKAGKDLPDLRGHECLAKHKLLSLFDLWRKNVRPRLPGFIDDEISQRDKLIEQMRETLELVKGISSSLPSFFFDAGEDKDGNECESIYECVCAAIKAAKGGKWTGNEQV